MALTIGSAEADRLARELGACMWFAEQRALPAAETLKGAPQIREV
ncbi:MAG: hypothetical protein ACREH6_05405 [Geminicoccaceae bacterium]